MAERGDGPTVITTTDRLVVRSWRLDEADRFFDIYRRPEVVRWIGAEPMRDHSEAITMINRNLTHKCSRGSHAAGGLAAGLVSAVFSVAFSSDGRALAAGGFKGTVEVWQTAA